MEGTHKCTSNLLLDAHGGQGVLQGALLEKIGEGNFYITSLVFSYFLYSFAAF